MASNAMDDELAATSVSRSLSLRGSGPEANAVRGKHENNATGREQSPREEAETTDHYRHMVELNPQVPWVADGEGRLRDFGARWLELTGLTREQALTDGWTNVPHPEDLPKMLDLWARATESGRPLDIEHRIRVADGSFRWVRSRAYPRHDSQGSIVNWYGFTEDIDGRIRTEQELARRANEQTALYRFTDRLHRAESLADIYEAALDSIVTALGCDRASVLLFDDEGVMRFVAWRGLSDGYRQAMEGHSPWGPEEVDARPIVEASVEHAAFSESLKATIQAEGIGALGFIPLDSNGKLVGKFMVYYDAPHRFGDEEIDLAMTIGRQLAFAVERMRAEESLRDNEERLRLATQTGKVGIWDWDIATNRVTWTDSLYAMHGLDRGAFSGTIEGFASLVHPEDLPRVSSAIDECLGQNTPYDLEFRIVRPNGDIVWLFTNAIVLRRQGKPYRMVGATVDITDRMDAENELREHQIEIEALNERLRRAMKETHHRVKNNLQIVGAMVDIKVMEGAETLPIAEVIRLGQTVKTLATVHDLLTEQARDDKSAETISAEAMLQKLIALLEHSVRGCRLVPAIEDFPLSARQGTSLAIVVNELVSNAAKHARAQIEIRLAVSNAVATLTVSDDGPGFPEGFDPTTSAHTGLELIENLSTWDLRGATNYYNGPSGGAQVQVVFPIPDGP